MTHFIPKMLLLIAVPFLASCWDSKEGQKLAEGKERGAQAEAALERYKAIHGHYPKSLSALYPNFVKTPLKEFRPGKADDVTFIYELTTGGTYNLTFHYTGPGVNNCTLQPKGQSERWHCSGFY
jgi:hypothetical protein